MKQCYKCEKEVEENSKHCSYCGENLVNNDAGFGFGIASMVVGIYSVSSCYDLFSTLIQCAKLDGILLFNFNNIFDLIKSIVFVTLAIVLSKKANKYGYESKISSAGNILGKVSLTFLILAIIIFLFIMGD